MSQNIRGLRWFPSFLVEIIICFVFFVLIKYPQVCERCISNRTHPNGRPKGDGGRGVG